MSGTHCLFTVRFQVFTVRFQVVAVIHPVLKASTHFSGYLTHTFRFSNIFLLGQDLLTWLQAQKAKGYYVVGLEQTSSSVSLSKMVFPDVPTVLLLGKEKEGIPVEYLQAVDQCVEIPQLGIIRSLNVHVSGAICIWEITKQRLEKGL